MVVLKFGVGDRPFEGAERLVQRAQVPVGGCGHVLASGDEVDGERGGQLICEPEESPFVGVDGHVTGEGITGGEGKVAIPLTRQQGVQMLGILLMEEAQVTGRHDDGTANREATGEGVESGEAAHAVAEQIDALRVDAVFLRVIGQKGAYAEYVFDQMGEGVIAVAAPDAAIGEVDRGDARPAQGIWQVKILLLKVELVAMLKKIHLKIGQK